ncbi:cytochrome c oxidase assembly protein [Streptomyces erythrochromogenes]|uniref:cytochrome c oxidase assembly protein n=1 Tax=Streptomyces erythrochromogenes TaxID=285574 RepID=UPI0033E45319
MPLVRRHAPSSYDRWPAGRAVAWTLGLAVTVLAMTVPILLLLGAPATLALRTLPAAGKCGPAVPREALTRLPHSRYVWFSIPVLITTIILAVQRVRTDRRAAPADHPNT